MSRDPEALDVNVTEKPAWRHVNGYFEPVLDNVVGVRQPDGVGSCQ